MQACGSCARGSCARGSCARSSWLVARGFSKRVWKSIGKIPVVQPRCSSLESDT